MKYCSACELDKPFESFNKNKAKKDGYGSTCRECMKVYRKAYYQANTEGVIEKVKLRKIELRKELYEYKASHPCVDCEESDPIVLEFDHLGEDEKLWNISEMIHRGLGRKAILDEIAKCDVVCANCHRRRTAKRASWYNY